MSGTIAETAPWGTVTTDGQQAKRYSQFRPSYPEVWPSKALLSGLGTIYCRALPSGTVQVSMWGVPHKLQHALICSMLEESTKPLLIVVRTAGGVSDHITALE